jgi:resuscitation-promoting factor RpfB
MALIRAVGVGLLLLVACYAVGNTGVPVKHEAATRDLSLPATAQRVMRLPDEDRVAQRPPKPVVTLTAVTAPAKASRQATRRRYAGPVTDDVWAALSRCEAGGRPNAVSRSGKYYGAFQFSLSTWHNVGMSGSPIDYPYEVQLEAAKRLQAHSGWGQWPVCSRKLGLR